MDLNIITLNINHTYNLCGLLDKLKSGDVDICFLQETGHSCEELNNLISRYDYKGFTSREGEKPGVGIVYKSSLEITEIHAWQPGRILYVKLPELDFINVYAPSGNTKAHERNIFFGETLFRNLQSKNRLPILIGDFNCILKPSDTTANFQRKQCKPLENLIHLFGYKDCHEILNLPSDFTFYRNGLAPSRLDRVYIPEYLVSQILNLEYLPTTSDHKAVKIELDIQICAPINRNKCAYWKLNTSILKHSDFLPNFVKLWQKLLNFESEYISCEVWWENLAKPCIKDFCIKFSTMVARGRQGMKAYLFEALNHAYNIKDDVEIQEIKTRLRNIINEESLGFVIRSKEQNLVEGEKATIYHKNREVKLGNKANLETLKINGAICDNFEIIQNTLVNYFSALFNGHHRSTEDSNVPVDTGASFEPDLSLLPDFLQGLGQLDDTEADGLEHLVTLDELKAALKTCARNRSPGLDGLSYEFFQATQEIIGPKLVEIFNNQLINNEMLPSFRKGVCRLISKVEDTPAVSELRPITLLSCDSKILSKIFMLRLNTVLDKVLLSSQLCYKEEKNILFGATNIISTIDYIDVKNLQGYLASFDLFKAYDKANINVICEIMKHMNFKPKFISYIKTLHFNISTCFITAQGLTEQVPVTSSVRQGDPIAMLCFLILIEPLLLHLHREVKGVHVGRNKQGDEAYVDDVSLLSCNENDLNKIFSIFEKFENLSGMVLNKNKCQILGLGIWKDKTEWPLNWIKTVNHMKIFGVTFASTIDKTIKLSWTNYEVKFHNCLMSWRGKNINSLSERAFVLKTFATSKLWYLAQVLPLPKSTLDYIERELGLFLWRGHLERLPLQELYLEKNKGGLGLPNIQAKCDALFLMHIVRILKTDTSTRNHLIYWLGLTKVMRSNFSNIINIGPKSEIVTFYFKHICNLMEDESLSIPLNSANLVHFKSKSIYADFNTTPPPPKVEDKFNLNWQEIWRRLDSNFVGQEASNVMFIVVHNIYSNNERLFRMNKHPSGICFCNRNSIQNNVHLFTECKRTKDCWIYLKNKLISNSIIENHLQSNFDLLMLNAKVEKNKVNSYVSMLSNYLLYVHQCIRNDIEPKINDLKGFLRMNCHPQLKLIF